ncbi:DUF342 domain-containing protein [Bacillus sp. Bva_UNVM-123]|uniref:DUF342 domain-containing protein n=1 Tax=Bacillus sp. Bva_UNVM-123 TaxID=2829798 RepID=UPI00391F2080
MEEHFRISISQDRLSAKIDLIKKIEPEFSFTVNELNEFLKKEKITFGLKENRLAEICENPNSNAYPVIIAEGSAVKNGVDAYLVNEVRFDKTEKREKFNFRNVLKIPSVKSGQLLASIIPPTPGTDGTDVTGRKIPAKNGKQLKIRPGKNVIVNGENFYSTSDGQLSVTNKMVSVNPVFEVNGDIDLKTGNIDFIGNVEIRGNVPSGYEIKAGGDIKIFGLVESATIHADGNIVISGGVTGGNKGSVTAGGNIQATYLNQAIVRAGQDIIVASSILHSKVEAGGSIYCNNALVIGGVLLANGNLHIKDVGNHLFTKTELKAGSDTTLTEKEHELKKQKAILSDNVSKLTGIEQKILQIGKSTGKLTEEQRTLILKQQKTKRHLLEQIQDIEDELEEIEAEVNEKQDTSIYIYNIIYPNSSIQYGKYTRQIQKEFSNVRFYFSNGEILFSPI